jgi:hypothetical protein
MSRHGIWLAFRSWTSRPKGENGTGLGPARVAMEAAGRGAPDETDPAPVP